MADTRVADSSSPGTFGSPDEMASLVQLCGRIQEAMIDRGLTLATAESCTGGLIGHLITETGGSSAFYIGGIVSYSDEMKRSALDVPAHVLESHGAVSAQTGVAMAEGARRRYNASMAVSVTGIAGPLGGSPDKPVGLTYVAVADARGHDVRRNLWHEDRHGNKARSAEAALTLVLERLSTQQQG